MPTKKELAVQGRCPVCGALPGVPCDPKKGHYWGPSQEAAGAHLSRIYDYVAAAAEAKELDEGKARR